MAEYIKRETAVKAANEWVSEACMAPVMRVSRLLDKLQKVPAADVAQVVHGRWISWEKAGNYVPSPDRHECSVCHDAAQVLVNGFELLSDYCPNCGAKMDGDRKDGGDG